MVEVYNTDELKEKEIEIEPGHQRNEDFPWD